MVQNAAGAPLLLVEDDPELGAMLVELLGRTYRVDLAPDGETGLGLALRRRYEAMVVDRRLPGIDGLQLVEAIRRGQVTTPILMLTALGTVDDRVTGLDGGANDYLVKPFDVEELLARLRALRRAFATDRHRRAIGDWTFLPETRTVYAPDGGRITLTGTESALLDHLSASPERVFGREELLEAAFGADDRPGTVDSYVHYIRRKTTPEMIETVRARGYRIGEPR